MPTAGTAFFLSSHLYAQIREAHKAIAMAGTQAGEGQLTWGSFSAGLEEPGA